MSRVLVLLVCIIAGQLGVNSETQKQLFDDEEFSCQTERPHHKWEILYRTRPTGTIKSPCYGNSSAFPNELPSGYKLVNLYVRDTNVIGYKLKIDAFNITSRNRLYIGDGLRRHGPLEIANRNWTLDSDDSYPNMVQFHLGESIGVSFRIEVGKTYTFYYTSLYMDYYTIDNTEFVEGFKFSYTTVYNDTSTTTAATTPVSTTSPPSTTAVSSSKPGTTSSVTSEPPATSSVSPSSTSNPTTSSTASTTTTKNTQSTTPESTTGTTSTTTPETTSSPSTNNPTIYFATTTITPPPNDTTTGQPETCSCVDCRYYTATIVLGVLLAIAIWLIIVLAVILIRKNGFCCSCSSVGACCGNITPCVNCCQEES